MVTQAISISVKIKRMSTFASYEEGDELFSDRNVFPRGCIVKKMEKIIFSKGVFNLSFCRVLSLLIF